MKRGGGCWLKHYLGRSLLGGMSKPASVRLRVCNLLGGVPPAAATVHGETSPGWGGGGEN